MLLFSSSISKAVESSEQICSFTATTIAGTRVVNKVSLNSVDAKAKMICLWITDVKSTSLMLLTVGASVIHAPLTWAPVTLR
ncbi:MAG: hypothetical protein ACR2O9_02490 [Alphaproteobacteria bacterium]